MRNNPRSINTIGKQVYTILRDDISNGVYPAGYWLQENELANTLNVSRSPVREALRRLVSDRLVVAIPNKGIFIRKFTAKDIQEIFDVRLMLETYAILNLPPHLSPSKTAPLTICLDNLCKTHKANNLKKYIVYDSDLHNIVINLCDNTLVHSIYEQVYILINQFRIYSLKDTIRFDESVGEHKCFIGNIIAGNYKKAASINEEHLKLAKEKIIEYLEMQNHDHP